MAWRRPIRTAISSLRIIEEEESGSFLKKRTKKLLLCRI
jgi:hypothetical protein